MHVNLLPRRMQLKIQLRGKLRRWALIWAATVACGVLYCSTQVRELWDVRRNLELLDTRCRALRKLETAMNADQEKLTELVAEKKVLEQLEPDEHLLDLLGVVTGAAKPLKGKLRLQRLGLAAAPRLVVNSSQVARTDATTAVKQVPMAIVTLHGVAEDDQALAQYVLELRATPAFDRVDLKSSSQLSGAVSTNRQFQLECRYEDQP